MASKLILIKGQNTPIVLTLRNVDFTQLGNCSLLIYAKDGSTVYSSTSPVIDTTAKTLTFAVTQTASLQWKAGECTLEFKCLIGSDVVFAKEVDVDILDRLDSTNLA